MLSVHRDRLFVTDPPHRPLLDSVFPLCHENRYFVEHLIVPEGAFVLDLCTGSGILAVFAAERAQRVIASDINPRALEFARLNAALNGVDGKIEFRLGDLFEPVKGMRFDLITVNPPFEPTPKGWENYLHSDGGPSGLDIVARIFEQAGDYLMPNGTIQIITYIPVGRLSLINHIRAMFRKVIIDDLGTVDGERFRFFQSKRLIRIAEPPLPLEHADYGTLRYVHLKASGLQEWTEEVN